MKLREHISVLENSELVTMFQEMLNYERKGYMPEDAYIRRFTRIYMDDNISAIQVVGYETCREMAYRWKEGEICQ